MKKLSVIIPVYNAIKYLDPCIGSVLRQTRPCDEIILVDDGSSDGSERLCDEYESKYPFIRVIRQENGGASAARNTGLRAAQGEYVHFIDSDDMLASDDVYEKLCENALDGENEIIFFRRERFIDGVEGIDAVQPEYKIDGRFEGDVLGHVLENQYEMTVTCPVNKIFKRSFLLDNDLFFTVGLHHEEDEWLPRVIANARIVRFDKGIYYSVRNHPDSMSKTTTPELEADRACSKIIIASTGMEYMERLSLPPETLSAVAQYYWDYLTDACVTCSQTDEKELREKIYHKLEEHKDFFKSRRYLKSRNRRVLGLLFQLLGVRITVRLVGIRYGK